MIKTRKEIIGFDDKWLMIIGIPLVALMVNAILFGEISLKHPKIYFGTCQLIALFYTATFWFLFRESHFRLLRLFPNPQQTIRRLTYTALFAILAYILLNSILNPLFKPYFPHEFQPDDIVKNISSFLFISLITGIYESLHLSNRLRQSVLEKERLMKENINSQLESLRNQVNPHFLFNSLNTLASIIPEDAEKGVHFVTKMAKVYRYILESRNEKLILLKDELDFLDAYVYLLKQRFGENLSINIELPERIHSKLIIPLSLQITFENAIKHNVISREKPLTIEVFVDGANKLVVRNTLQKKKVLPSSTKVGLQNIKNRYAFYTEKTVDISADQNHFTVMLPLLDTQKLNHVNT